MEEPTAYLMSSTAHLKHKLGPVLFQLPPNAKKNTERLKVFLGTLPADRQVTFEFRHPTWFEADALDALRDHGAALCIADDEKELVPFEATTDWGYLRLRKGEYTQDSLTQWAKRILAVDWRVTFAFFEGDEDGRGPQWASQLMAVAGK